jgi:hypothetical protein
MAQTPALEGTEMTNRMRETTLQHPALEHPAGDVSAPALAGPDASASSDASRPIRRAGLIAGAALMVMAALAGFGNIVVLQGLVTPGDAAKTAGDVMRSDAVFRFGVASLYLVVVLDVVIAWALLRVFSPVNRDVSRLAAWFRLTYAGVFMVALSQLAGIPELLSGAGYSASFTPAQRQGLALLRIDTFNDIWSAGLILFGVHLLILGYLAYKSGYVPRVLGILLVIAGVGYVFDSFVAVFSDGSPFAISTVTFLGEFLLGLWLLIRGRISAFVMSATGAA